MNRIRATLVAATLVSGFFAAPTWAQTATPRLDQRQANQEQRIDRASSAGALTEREAARLDKGQERLENMEEKASADGKVTRKERAHLEHAQIAVVGQCQFDHGLEFGVGEILLPLRGGGCGSGGHSHCAAKKHGRSRHQRPCGEL